MTDNISVKITLDSSSVDSQLKKLDNDFSKITKKTNALAESFRDYTKALSDKNAASARSAIGKLNRAFESSKNMVVKLRESMVEFTRATKDSGLSSKETATSIAEFKKQLTQVKNAIITASTSLESYKRISKSATASTEQIQLAYIRAASAMRKLEAAEAMAAIMLQNVARATTKAKDVAIEFAAAEQKLAEEAKKEADAIGDSYKSLTTHSTKAKAATADTTNLNNALGGVTSSAKSSHYAVVTAYGALDGYSTRAKNAAVDTIGLNRQMNGAKPVVEAVKDAFAGAYGTLNIYSASAKKAAVDTASLNMSLAGITPETEAAKVAFSGAYGSLNIYSEKARTAAVDTTNLNVTLTGVKPAVESVKNAFSGAYGSLNAYSEKAKKAAIDTTNLNMALSGTRPAAKAVTDAYAGAYGSLNAYSAKAKSAAIDVTGLNKALGGAVPVAKELSTTAGQLAIDLDKTAAKTNKFAGGLKRLRKSMEFIIRMKFANYLYRLWDAINPVALARLQSEFLGFRNAMMVTADASGTMTEKINHANDQMVVSARIAKDYRVHIDSVAKAYSKFSAAVVLASGRAEGSIKVAEHQFRAFAKVGRIMNLNKEQMHGLFLSIEQMTSKGFVSMEELRRQMGQYLPGSMELAAEAMDLGKEKMGEFFKLVASGTLKTSKFMPKFVKKINETYGGDILEQALKKPTAAFAELANSLDALKLAFAPALVTLLMPFVKGLTMLANALTKLVGVFFEVDSFVKVLTSSNKNVGKSFESVASEANSVNSELTAVSEAADGANESLVKIDKTATSLGEKAMAMKESFMGLTSNLLFLGITAAALIKPFGLILKGFKWLFSPLAKITVGIWAAGKAFLAFKDKMIAIRVAIFAARAALASVAATAAVIAAPFVAFFGIIAGGIIHYRNLKQAHEETMQAMVNYKAPPISNYDAEIIVLTQSLKKAKGSQATFNATVRESIGLYNTAVSVLQQFSPELSKSAMALASLKKLRDEALAQGNDTHVKMFNQAIATVSKSVNEQTNFIKANAIAVAEKQQADFEAAWAAQKLGHMTEDYAKQLYPLVDEEEALRQAKLLGIKTTSDQMKGIRFMIKHGLTPEHEAVKTLMGLYKNADEAKKRQNKTKPKALKDNLKAIDDLIRAQKDELHILGLDTTAQKLYRIEMAATKQEQKLWNLVMKDTATDLETLNQRYAEGVAAIRATAAAQKEAIKIAAEQAKLAAVRGSFETMTDKIKKQEQAYTDLIEVQHLMSSDEFNERLKAINESLDTGIIKTEEWAVIWTDVMGQAIGDFAEGAADSIVEFATTGAVSFKEMAASILSDISKMIIKMLILKAIESSISSFNSTGSAAAGSSKEMGNFMSADFDSISAAGIGTGFEKGGVFNKGNVVPFARGGVINKPVLFPMANGAGLAGEAGPEAIMPLKRGRNGKLGVESQAAHSTIFNITIAANEEGKGYIDKKSMAQLHTKVMNANGAKASRIK